MSLSHYVWLPYIFMPHTGHRARARPPARAHTPRAHTRTPVSTQTHTPREWTQDSAQCRRRIYMRVSPRGHGNFQLFRVLPLWGTIYPSDMKVGNLLPACDWNMSSFLYRYNFRFWSFLLRSHWCAGALAAAPLWALCARVAPALVFCPLPAGFARCAFWGRSRCVPRRIHTYTHTHHTHRSCTGTPDTTPQKRHTLSDSPHVQHAAIKLPRTRRIRRAQCAGARQQRACADSFIGAGKHAAASCAARGAESARAKDPCKSTMHWARMR